jgi:hypothetical protein
MQTGDYFCLTGAFPRFFELIRFVLENGQDGRDLYQGQLEQDDFDPSQHEGLDLETRLDNAGRAIWGSVDARRVTVLDMVVHPDLL